MARYTMAYSAFITRLGEVDRLRRLAAVREREDPVGNRHDTDALCRGAVVLLCGHLEGFIRELGEVALDTMTVKGVARTKLPSQVFYHISKDILAEVKDTVDPAKLGDRVFHFLQSDLSYWSRTGPFPQPIPTDRFSKGFASPAFKKIKKYFNRFGYSSYDHDLARRLQAAYQPMVNMVDHLVETRNRIAHGDPSATKTPGEVRDMIALIRVFCRSTDAIFARWWKASFCSIR